MMLFLRNLAAALLLFQSTIINASVITTLNGTSYEWYEVSNTAGLSRTQVEAMLLDSNSDVYGYEYASRLLLEDLFLSYSSWDGVDGWHGDAGVVTGITGLMTDFGGATYTYAGTGVNKSARTVDGYTANYDGYQSLNALYGGASECGDSNYTCIASLHIYYDAVGNSAMALQDKYRGWDSNYSNPYLHFSDRANDTVGSFLVRALEEKINVSTVPVPAAAWLFGSALLGFVGFSRRNKKQG